MIQISTFLVVQWLRFHAPNTGGGDVGLISGQDLKPHVPCSTAKKRKEKKKVQMNILTKKKQTYRLQK